MKSAVLILPAALRDKGDAAAERIGWGAGVFSVGLTSDGASVTHFACRADVGDDFALLLVPESGFPAEMIVDISEKDSGIDHWRRALLDHRLDAYVEPPAKEAAPR